MLVITTMSRSIRRRSLGKIVSVVADHFTVELNSGSDSFTLVGFDAQHYVARIGSFVLIPLQTDYVVAEVVGLREREVGAFDRVETELADSDALNSAKFLDVVPVGTLPLSGSELFRFGVSVYPPLYAETLYAESEDLDRIFEVRNAREPATPVPDGPTRLRAFEIGTSVVFDDYQVKVRLDEFFGGHCAILGNTGSGKSCTVASVLQAIFEKESTYLALGASFLFMDTNGEYRQAFAQLSQPIRRLYGLVPGPESDGSDPTPLDPGEDALRLRLPHWFMSPEEWELLLRASDRAQRPILRTALGLTSLFVDETQLEPLKDHVMATALMAIMSSSESAPAMANKIQGLVLAFKTQTFTLAAVAPLLANNFGKFLDDGVAFRTLVTSKLLDEVTMPDYQYAPFEFPKIIDAIELAILYEEAHGNVHIRDYCSSMLTRVKSIRDRREFRFMRPELETLLQHEEAPEPFVDLLLGLKKTSDGEGFVKSSQITIIDMNEVEDEIVEVVSAVITRLIFERLRRAKIRNAFPVNLVLEEAHRYIADKPSEFALDATRIFERVAKEGRKYGLLLMIASQRPSELSKTVLSQCSNFIIHRIQNPEDLQHIRRMTPFISESVLGRLPALPKQHALIFGNSVNVPMTFKVRDAVPRPRSEDAKVGEIWFEPEGSLHKIL